MERPRVQVALENIWLISIPDVKKKSKSGPRKKKKKKKKKRKSGPQKKKKKKKKRKALNLLIPGAQMAIEIFGLF